MKILLLMGGVSPEREISLRSGSACLAALKRLGHQTQALDLTSVHELIDAINQFKPDCCFLSLHGALGEDGCVQGVLEWLQVPYTGSSVEASAIASNKSLMKQLASSVGIVVPQGYLLAKPEENPRLSGHLIVKPNDQGSTLGMTRVFEPSQWKDALEKAFAVDHQVLVEELIEGREITVSVLDGQALPIIEIKPHHNFYDYQAKYFSGTTQYIVPAPLDKTWSDSISQQCVDLYRSFGFNGAIRADFLLKDSKAYFLEVNTLPGMTETSLLPKAASAFGLNFDELCQKLVNQARCHRGSLRVSNLSSSA